MSRHAKPLEEIRALDPKLFSAAAQEASLVGETQPGVEHLILASFDLADGSTRRTFQRAGVYPKAFRDAVAGQRADALRAAGTAAQDGTIEGRQHAEPSSQSVLERVVKLVKKTRSRLYGAHIVLVAAEAGHLATVRALARLGVHREDLADAARIELDALHVED